MTAPLFDADIPTPGCCPTHTKLVRLLDDFRATLEMHDEVCKYPTPAPSDSAPLAAPLSPQQGGGGPQ